MIGRSIRNALVPISIMAVLAVGPARGQGTLGDWTIYPSTGDIGDIEILGTTAWIAARGGIVTLDLSTAAQDEPVQRKITESDGLVDANVSSLAIDGFGNVWVGTRDNGISIFDQQGEHIQDLSSILDLWSDRVIDMEPFGTTMYVVCTDQYTANGGLDGGGYVPIQVSQVGGDFEFARRDIGIGIGLAQVIYPEPGVIWVGTSGSGLWRVEETTGSASPEVALDQSTGLLSGNVKQIIRAPNPDQGGANALWLGTGLGLQSWDGTSVSTVVPLAGLSILDVYLRGTTMLVLAEDVLLRRDLFQLNLTTPGLAVQRIARSGCFPDTLYVPREVAMDASGRMILGTRDVGFSVREPAPPFTWHCPPLLGPHFSQIADLALAPDGVLYFATGEKGAFLEGVGIGTYDGTKWGVITADSGLVHRDIHEVAVWPDTTLWFGSSISAGTGGLNHYFPRTGTFVTYHNTVLNPNNQTQGKNCQSVEVDRFGNLWISYGQVGGGVSVIEPSLVVTNFNSGELEATGNELLRDLAFDSRNRVWITTFSDQNRPGTIYVLDPRGTFANKADDVVTVFNVAGQIADLGTINHIEIDSEDQIWLAGEKGLAIGQIGPDIGVGEATADWDLVNPGTDQTDGRNPLPYTAAELGEENSIWLGTEAAGIVNVTKDASTWTWFDQQAGTPLPDQSITGIYVDPVTGFIWIGTATAGIARLDPRGGGITVEGDRLSLQLYPNPWRPSNGPLSFLAIPPNETTTIRIYDVSGDLVYEAQNLTGTKTWSGINSADKPVKGGTYIMTATSTNGRVYEGKVAIVR